MQCIGRWGIRGRMSADRVVARADLSFSRFSDVYVSDCSTSSSKTTRHDNQCIQTHTVLRPLHLSKLSTDGTYLRWSVSILIMGLRVRVVGVGDEFDLVVSILAFVCEVVEEIFLGL